MTIIVLGILCFLPAFICETLLPAIEKRINARHNRHTFA